MKTELKVNDSNYRKRLDRFLQKELDLPYSAIMRLIRQGDVKINNRRVKQNSFQLSIGDDVEIYYKSPVENIKRPLKSINLNLKILYEDNDYSVLSKPSGLAVQGGSKINLSLLNHLTYLYKTPFLVHRLDKDTSGVIIVAKNLKASQEFMKIMTDRKIVKVYLALLKNKIDKKSLRVSSPINGKEAETLFKVKKFYNTASLVEARIFTGRKHQIRIHASHIGNPIAGDKKYGDFKWNRGLVSFGLKRIFLHAHYIKFLNPISGKIIEVEDPLPTDLNKFLEKL